VKFDEGNSLSKDKKRSLAKKKKLYELSAINLQRWNMSYPGYASIFNK